MSEQLEFLFVQEYLGYFSHCEFCNIPLTSSIQKYYAEKTGNRKAHLVCDPITKIVYICCTEECARDYQNYFALALLFEGIVAAEKQGKLHMYIL